MSLIEELKKLSEELELEKVAEEVLEGLEKVIDGLEEVTEEILESPKVKLLGSLAARKLDELIENEQTRLKQLQIGEPQQQELQSSDNITECTETELQNDTCTCTCSCTPQKTAVDQFSAVSGQISSAMVECIDGVVNGLHAEGLIDCELKDEINNSGEINARKADKLMIEIERRLHNDDNPDLYLHRLCVVLKKQQDTQLSEIVVTLIPEPTDKLEYNDQRLALLSIDTQNPLLNILQSNVYELCETVANDVLRVSCSCMSSYVITKSTHDYILNAKGVTNFDKANKLFMDIFLQLQSRKDGGQHHYILKVFEAFSTIANPGLTNIVKQMQSKLLHLPFN